MLQSSLIMQQVILPEHPPGLPAPLDLEVGLLEVLEIEGLSLAESEAMLEVASTLEAPLEGQVWHWGKEAIRLPREEIFDLRAQIAFITPRQVLLHRLTLRENIAMGPCYNRGLTTSEAIHQHAALLAQLELAPYLAEFPPQVPEDIYYRALWAREMVKVPELILAVAAEPLENLATQKIILAVLQDYLEKQRCAVLLVGQSLRAFHPLAHRVLKLESGRFVDHHLVEAKGRPLVNFLPLV